jgi:hypothetical protein
VTLTSGKDYVATFSETTTVNNGKTEKSVTIYLDMTGNYKTSGGTKLSKPVTRKQIVASDVTVADAVYTGEELEPVVTVTGTTNGVYTTQNPTGDYTVTYKNNTEVGTGIAVITGVNDFYGTVEKEFKITGKSIALTTIDFDRDAYDKGNVEDSILVSDTIKQTVAGKAAPETKEVSLIRDADYTLTTQVVPATSSSDPILIATIEAKEGSNYTGKTSARFVISAPESIKDAKVEITDDVVDYTGEALTPEIKVTLDEGATYLKEDLNYTINWDEVDNVNAGEVEIIITGKGAYTGSTKAKFTIAAKSIDGVEITVNGDNYNADADASVNAANVVTVKDGERTLTLDKDYTVTFQTAKESGKTVVTAVVTGKTNYEGTKNSKSFEVADKIDLATATATAADVVYNGEAQESEVTVTVGDTTLVKGTDYTVKYSKDTTNVGNVVATITGTGKYTGTTTAEYKITAVKVSKVTLASSSVTYTGKAQSVKVKSVTDANGNTVDSSNYTVSYSDDKVNVGTVTVKVTGSGNYTGTVKATYKIKAQSIKDATVKNATATKTYTGKALKQSGITVTLNGKTLASDAYKVSYSNNKEPGKATVTIKGQGNYSGTITRTFTIKPAKATVKSAKSSKAKKATVTWNKVTKADGYVVYRSTSKNGTYKAVATVKGGSKTSYTDSKLTSGKTYYYKVAAYKTIDKKNVEGSKSAAKSVKVK